MFKTLKRKFKKTKFGRVLRHIRNFYWRAFLDERALKKNDPTMWLANYMRGFEHS